MESLPENEVMTEELSVQLATDDEQEQRMEMEDSDQGEGEGEGSECIGPFNRSQNKIMKLIFGGEGDDDDEDEDEDESEGEDEGDGEGEGEGEGGERISLFDRSQNEIMKLIFAVNYRVPDEGHASFDVHAIHAIFSTSQQIIKDSAKIIHNIIEQGSGINDVETPKASSCLCTLINSFGCKMSCKSPGDENAFESRTEETLTKLSSYPCEVQVVLALAIFSLEYEECSSQLSKNSTSLKRQDVVVELNNLVNQALQVIEHILELEKLISGDRDSEPKLAGVIMDTPFNAYWSIITLVACATELSLLTSDE